ncbi:hypothetical protein [uncultured Ruegeria sp.]|uniref:hypothetical protein n=1 Tax=uncultured Ruegeria sp. TaxID=259304 RepID=UPI002633CF86|nr:hypothetical protein [uncultured Ruegeria sp.]
MSIKRRINKLETQSADGPRQFTVIRTIVSRCVDGRLTERLSTIRSFGNLLRRNAEETDDEFLARADSELKEQNQ